MVIKHKRENGIAVALVVLLFCMWASHAQGLRLAPKAPAGGEAVAEAEGEGAGENLLPNGDFETPAEDGTHPAHWQEIDNLIFFWTTDPEAPERGKVMKINTDVYQQQAYGWWIDRFVHGKPASEAPARKATSGLKYDTIAGLDGGYYWSDFIEIKKGGAYRVYIDAKGPGAFVFIRGYDKELPRRGAGDAAAVPPRARGTAQGQARASDQVPIAVPVHGEVQRGRVRRVEDVHAREAAAPEQPGDHGERPVCADLHLSVLAAGDVLV